MNGKNSNTHAESHAAKRWLPLLLVLFVGSGCAALIYEIVWLQLLQLVIGSSGVSLGVLLGTFMGGMCLGSLALPRFVSAARHPLRVYAALELAIGALGIGILFLLPLVTRLYVASAGYGLGGILVRGTVCGVCLLPPTLLMGATLPAVARWIEATPRGVSWLGFFYGGNIAGGVCGCLLAGFYLLRVHDMPVATYAAACINVAVAVAAMFLSVIMPHEAPSESDESEARRDRDQSEASLSSPWPVYLVIAMSGMTALGAEVVWTRLLSLLIGGTVYTFSIILAVFLVGLGIGSAVGSMVARESKRPRFALGCCQGLLVAALGWAAFAQAKSLPYWPIDLSVSMSPWFNFQLDLARCLWAVLPASCLWGASFPIALACVASRGQDPGRLVGRVYAANTLGAICGAIVTSIVLIAWIGTQHAQMVLAGVATLAALFMLVPALWSSEGGAAAGKVSAAASILALLVVAGWVVWNLPQIPWGLVSQGRNLAAKGADGKLLYMGEGMNASVAVTETSGNIRNFHVSGKIEASTDPRDMRLQRMLGHIPALIHPHPKSVLIVGCGAGVTAGSFLTYPGIEKITICEIEPLIPRVVAQYFNKENYGVVTNSRVRIVFDDARNFVLTTHEKFDIITSDPIHPWVKGAASLYTREYFELCRQHLNPGGFVTQWIPLYESAPGVVESELATFFDVFPGGTLWSNDDAGEGYDAIVLGPADPAPIDVDEVQRRLESPGYMQVLQSLKDVSYESAIDLLASYAGDKSDLAPWLKDAEINRDMNLRLQFLAGMGSNLYREGAIYNEILRYRRYPADLFKTTEETRKELVADMATHVKAGGK